MSTPCVSDRPLYALKGPEKALGLWVEDDAQHEPSVLSKYLIHHAIGHILNPGCEFCDTVGTLTLHSISPHSELPANLEKVRRKIVEAAVAAGRDPASVTLIAVSKTHSAKAVEQALAAGCRDFGENYLSDALSKIRHITSPDIVWHFIGAIQSNKTRDIAENFHWIHTLDRAKVARRLNMHCPAGKFLNVCIQVNIDRDPNKAGVDPDEAGDLLDRCRGLENLNVRGLMTILDPSSDALASYTALKELHESLRPDTGSWDTLSMGMSGDYTQAIAAGATCVRVGTAIFGPRVDKA